MTINPESSPQRRPSAGEIERVHRERMLRENAKARGKKKFSLYKERNGIDDFGENEGKVLEYFIENEFEYLLLSDSNRRKAEVMRAFPQIYKRRSKVRAKKWRGLRVKYAEHFEFWHTLLEEAEIQSMHKYRRRTFPIEWEGTYNDLSEMFGKSVPTIRNYVEVLNSMGAIEFLGYLPDKKMRFKLGEKVRKHPGFLKPEPLLTEEKVVEFFQSQ